MKTSAAKWLFAIPGKKKLYILALTLAQAVLGASGVLYALLLRGVVDAAVDKNLDAFWKWLVLTILLVAVQIALRALIRWLTELSRTTFENIFKQRLADTILRKDFLRVSAVHSGEWLNRLTSDTVVVADAYVDILPGLAGMVVKLISALVMIIILEPRFAYILIPGGAIVVLLTWLFRRVMKRLHKNVQEADGRLRVFLQERIGSLLMIRSFAAEAKTEAEAEAKMEDHKGARMRRMRFSNFANTGFGVVMNAMYLLGIGWCGYGILKGTITFGTLTAITQLISQIQIPFANISGYLPRYYSMLASAERLMEAEAFDESGQEAQSLEEMKTFYDKQLSSFGLAGVSFAYYPSTDNMGALSKDEMPTVLHDLDLSIRKGEYVAFTGHSGCGKSTALKLLMCVYQPDEGERFYEDAAGERWDLTSAYRRLFAYVPQGNYLMSGTIREVVCFAGDDLGGDGNVAASGAEDVLIAKDATGDDLQDQKLKRALQIACAEEFVSELDKGVDTLLGERGTGLSEGQMQRLAIARAIYSESPVVLLDEVTSALDATTEKRLLENLRSMTDKTVVIITHRSAALEICDRVLEFTEAGLHEVVRD